MQAPQSPVPQPNFVPVSLRSSRITHNNGVAGGASVVAGLPFTVKSVAIASSLSPYGAKAAAGQHQSSGASEGIAIGSWVPGRMGIERTAHALFAVIGVF